MKPPVLTLELARRLERVLAEGYTAKQRVDQADKIHDREFGGTIAIKMPEAPWRNGVFCFSEADVDKLGDIAAYFRNDGVAFSFHLVPMGFTEEVGQALTQAGFFPAHQAQAILWGLPSAEPCRPPADLTVEQVTEDSLEDFLETNVQGFGYPLEWRTGIKEDLRHRFGCEGYHPYLARLKGQPAGCGSLIKQGEFGSLTDAAVVPTFRGKGCHAVLLQHRLHAAGMLGCRWVIGAAAFGSTSFRNQCRGGMQMAYIETTWKELPRNK